jgi:glycosyltransferase involved in cell wall biosynthesis
MKILLSVIIPSYNEANTILSILEKVNNQKTDNVDLEVIVINDGSSDKTDEVIGENQELLDVYISMDKNRGKGAAVKKGLEVAKGDYVIFQDADLEYDPNDFKKFYELLEKNSPDVVIGSRFQGSEYTKVMYFWNKIGNRVLTLFFNLLFNTTFTDIYSCYLLYKRDLVDFNNLKTNGWDQHGEILGTAVKNGNKFYEVSISYDGRTFADGKKIRARHFFKVLFTIFRKRLN